MRPECGANLLACRRARGRRVRGLSNGNGVLVIRQYSGFLRGCGAKLSVAEPPNAATINHQHSAWPCLRRLNAIQRFTIYSSDEQEGHRVIAGLSSLCICCLRKRRPQRLHKDRVPPVLACTQGVSPETNTKMSAPPL